MYCHFCTFGHASCFVVCGDYSLVGVLTAFLLLVAYRLSSGTMCARKLLEKAVMDKLTDYSAHREIRLLQVQRLVA